MKHSMRVVVGSLLLGLFASANVFAASDMYIKLGDIKGESKVVHCPGGACALSGLAAGSYQVQVCDEKGVPISSSVVLSHSITSPRDAASGLPTGKRQHKPMTIVKEWSKSTPQLFSLVVTEPGSSVTIQQQEAKDEVTAPKSGSGTGKVNLQDMSITR